MEEKFGVQIESYKEKMQNLQKSVANKDAEILLLKLAIAELESQLKLLLNDQKTKQTKKEIIHKEPTPKEKIATKTQNIQKQHKQSGVHQIVQMRSDYQYDQQSLLMILNYLETKEIVRARIINKTFLQLSKPLLTQRNEELTIKLENLNQKHKNIGEINMKQTLINIKESLQGIDKASITELKSLKNPPIEVDHILKCILQLLQPKTNFSSMSPEEIWKMSQTQMKNPKEFIDLLQQLDVNIITKQQIAKITKTFTKDYNLDILKSKSVAAYQLAFWLKNFISFYELKDTFNIVKIMEEQEKICKYLENIVNPKKEIQQ